jgi:hypothetical protein
MDFLNETRFIERLQFFNGQRLFASDLQGIEAFNREMRWLHNKSLHQPGIGNGFAVAGKKDDREVQIGPGYAIDALGREIVLTQTQVEPVPPVAGEEDGTAALFDLTVSYPDDEILAESETRVGICTGEGVIRLKEEPVFCWVRLNQNRQPEDAKIKQEILSGMRLILAQAEVLNCRLNKDVSIAQRTSARPAKQPYICCGRVTPDWQPWELTAFDSNRALSSRARSAAPAQFFASAIILPIGIQAHIDTSGCGFLTTPCYTARIAGPRVQQIDLSTGETSLKLTVVVDGLIQIIEPSPREFTLNVLLMFQALAPVNSLASVARSAGGSGDAVLKGLIADRFKVWSVEWMGVEG